MKIDVDDFVNCLNKNTSNSSSRKRRNNEITFNDLIFDLKATAFERLENLDKDVRKFKGRELTKFLKNLKETFSQISSALKSDDDPELRKQLSDIIRLALIAELAVCTEIIDDVNAYAVKENEICLNYFIINNKKIYQRQQEDNLIDISEIINIEGKQFNLWLKPNNYRLSSSCLSSCFKDKG